MGYNCHVHTKHVVEYGKGVCKNRKVEFNKLLMTFCDTFCQDLADSDELEVSSKSFDEFVTKMMDSQTRYKMFDEKGYVLPDCFKEEINELLLSLAYISFVADKSDEFIHLTWF